MCHTNAVFMRKSDTFKTATLTTLMKMLTEVEEGEWEDQLDDNFIQQNDISSATQDCLSKMSTDLSVKFLLPLYIPLVVKCL